MSRYTYRTVFTVTKWPLNENTVNCSEMFSKCTKLSLEQEVLHEIWTIFPGDMAKRISGNLVVESVLECTAFSELKPKEILIGKCKVMQNVNAPESKHLQLPARTDRRSLKTKTLDANWNTLTGLFLAFYRRLPYQCLRVNLPICLI